MSSIIQFILFDFFKLSVSDFHLAGMVCYVPNMDFFSSLKSVADIDMLNLSVANIISHHKLYRPNQYRPI